ncbi:PP2C family protein-serine/threonine phosphatase [Pseudonocardia yuanmonensis]
MTVTTGPSASRAEERELALDALGVRPEGREGRFDRITRLAQKLFGVEIAAVTVVDADTQWIKSVQGIDIPYVPLEDTFCRVTLTAVEQQTVIEDARADGRFADSPFVRGDPHVRFYAGHPLTTSSGIRVGTLCLIDPAPRRFGHAERTLLAELADWAGTVLRRTSEMERAAQVQRALLPQSGSITVPGYEVVGACVPARAVGGDLLDWYRVGDDDSDLAITLGDVMGKGIGAALLMATVRSALRTAGRELPPGEAVREAALALEADLEGTGTLVTLCQARLTPATGRLVWSDAGHGLLLLVRADGTVTRAPAGGLPLGTLPDDRWPEHEVHLAPGDAVVAFSDGLLDLYPTLDAAFADVARQVRSAPAAIGDHVSRTAERVRDLAAADDVTMVVVRRCP